MAQANIQPDVQSRGWCITINNPTKKDEEDLRNLPNLGYLVFGREKGESGTPHLQVFLYFTKRKRWSYLKKRLERAHIEAQKGSNEEASVYCKKDGDFEEIGELPPPPGEMEKLRWKRAREAAVSGDFESIPDDIFIRHFPNLKKIRAEYQIKPASLPEMDFHWWYGDSGTGKSFTAREENPDYYIKNPNKWWDGYKDQPCVIIDDWDTTHSCLGYHLKIWADHHPFQAETKGSSMCIRPPKIIVTSNYALEDVFTDPNILEPLKRRFKVKHFSKLS